jgi:nitroimidazol reductase NimA-like FMN-containing flavoprotein (pyridoxamine 5'-phosphate oxidase superfamily)
LSDIFFESDPLLVCRLQVGLIFTIKPLAFTIHDMNFPQTERTTLKRLPKRGVYERELVYQILDEGLICHVGFAVDVQTFVIPTGYARVEDRLYIHGSQLSRMLRTLSGGINVTVAVTLLDGLVLARSAFHHSMNYRSVVIFGNASLVDDQAEKEAALFAFSEHMIRGRWNDVREPTEQELKATTVLSLPITEASAKVRTGPPLDDEEDYALNVWAGVIPLQLLATAPIADPRLSQGVEPPAYARNYSREQK